MKNISSIFPVFFIIIFLGLFSHLTFGQIQDKSNFSYWQHKMEDPNQNFYDLVDEFDDYWKNKDISNTKGTGYKQFKRWQHANAGMVGQDGKLLPASYINEEVKKFNELYGSDAITGNWEFMGPDVVPTDPSSGDKIGIGRIATLAFHPTDQFTLYVGSPTGGIWKTTTGGNAWSNLNTDEIASFGVSAILVHPDYPNVIFVGTGDRDADEAPGQGIWKTIDGGNIWNHIPSGMDDKMVSEILLNPNNHDILLAAAEDGVYISTDAGNTWAKTIDIDVNVKDMTFKPGDPAYVYATGNGDFYRSINGGLSWSEITTGLDSASRCMIGVTPAQPNLVYLFATRDNKFEGFYISTNSGSTFPDKITPPVFDGEKQGGYNIALAVDPTDADVIFAGMVRSYKSIDGGNSWVKLTLDNSIHADQHDFKFSPHTNDLYFGNDGGLIRSSNLGSTFTNLSDGLEITQIARIAVNELNPDVFMAGLQDNGTIVPNLSDFHMILGGDGMGCAFDYTDDQYVYASWQNSHVHRSTEGAQTSTSLSCISCSIEDDAAWFRPIILDKDDPNTIFAGYRDVWRSNNVKATNPEDVSWANISNGEVNLDHKTSLMEQCQADGNIIYISKNRGERIYRTDNAYAVDPDWIEIYRPYNATVTWFETHPTNPEIVYMTIGMDVYKSTNRGANWFSIKSPNLPNIPMRCITYHHGSNEGLYVGTRAGVYYKDADMTNWALFKSGLPLVTIFDMKIIYSTEPDRLVVGTFGRGMWKTDVMPVMTPDLEPTNINTNIVGTQINMDVTVANNSQMGDAGPYHIGYYMSENDIISPGDFLLGEDSIHIHNPGLFVGEDITIEVMDIPTHIQAGTYYLGSFVDNREEVDEHYEFNNRITSAEQITLTDAPAPLNVQASDGTNGNKIDISWDPPPGPITYFYKVYHNTVDDPNTATPISSNPWNSITSFWDTTATRGIDNYYWIQASDTYLGFRAGPLSNSDAGWRYLSPPTNVEATDGQYDNRIALTWDAAESATHYMVWRHTTTDFNTATALLPSWTPTTTFTDWTAAPLTTYFYWVKSATSNSGDRESPNCSDYTSGYVALTDAPIANATDGLYDDRIEITWNSTPGATHYRLFQNTVDDPETASAIGAWQTETSQTITTAPRGVLYYYWIKAAADQFGGMPSGFGQGDSGWRSFEIPENVEASDGISTDYVEITWDNNNWADYYRVYRHINPTPSLAEPVSDWLEEDPGLTTTFNDSTPDSPPDYFYWVKCANDPLGEYPSNFSSYDIGYRKLNAPEVEATNGAYANKVRVTWDPVPGANSYRVIRFTPSTGIYDTLSDWSSTLNYQYNDYDVDYGVSWIWLYYYVDAAYNNYGYKPGDQGWDYGYPGECGNLTDDPNYRSINFHGSILEITQRVINNGSFPITNPSEVGFALEETPPEGSWNYLLGTTIIPALAVGAYYDVSFIVDLDTITDGPVPQGTWTVASYMPFGSANCQSNPMDDYAIWDLSFDYSDALYGTYTIGGTDPDFPTFNNAVVNLMNRGISDHITFNVRPGTYYEQIQLPDINGSGPDKTITFQTEPNKAENAELNFTSNEGNYIIRIDGCSYITIQNLDITAPGYSNNVSSYGIVLEFINDAHHISILNNTITGSSDDSFISSDNAVIYCENSECNDIIINDNEILNGSWGIHFAGVGAGTNASSGLEISGNTIQNFMYTGIKLQYQEDPQVIGNTIQFYTSNITQCYGIELENIEGSFKIDKNQVMMESCGLTNFGISMMLCEGDYSNRGLVSNNFVALISGGNTMYGIYSYHSDNIDYYHNSVNITGTNNQNNYCMYLDCSDVPKTYDNDILNNIFSNQAGGYSVLIGDNAITHNYVSLSDYNDLYITGPYIGLYGNTNQISDLTAWQTASGFDVNSLSTDPEFISSTDLHTFSYLLDEMATPVSSVTHDIDLEERNWFTPDIGADEFTPPPPQYDVGIAQISTPITGEDLTDQEPVTIAIDNTGTETIINLSVSYTINGGPPVTEIYPGPILAWEWHDYTFTTLADLSVVGSYEITAYTSLPGDERPGNDDHTVIVEHLPPTYCTPIYTNECNTPIFSVIDDFYLNTIEHEWTACSENGYGNYTGISTDLTQGQSYNMEVTVGYHNMYISLWIDLDNDTDFEPSEQLVSDLYCPNSMYSYSAPVDIPVSAIPGPHRLRVRAVHNETGFNACDEYLSGEVHDYMVNIVSGGNLSVDIGPDMISCFGTATSIIAIVTGGMAPYSYLWSTGETTPSISTTPLYDSLYSVIVTDAFGYAAYDEIELYLKPNPVAFATSNSPVCEESDISLYGTGNYFGMVENRCTNNCETLSYCESKASSSFGPNVEEVIFGDINNYTAGVCGDYSNYTVMKTTAVLNDTMNLFVTLADCDNSMMFSRGGKAFIDWNRDGDFEDGDELVGIFGISDSGGSYDTTVIIPSNAVLGKTILRVVTSEALEIDSVQPCGTYWIGETEDYTVEIIERTDNYIDTYSWIGPDSYTSVEQNPVISSATPLNDGTYTLTVADGNGCTAINNTDLVVKIDPTADAGPNDVICETEVYSLTGQATDYSSVLWSSSGTGTFDNINILDPEYTPSNDDINNGEVMLSLLAYASAPCSNTALSSMTLTIIKQPVVFAGNDATISEGETYVINEATASEISNLEWSANGTGTFDDIFVLNPEYTPGTGETGTILLILTGYANSPCSEKKDTMELDIIPYAGFDLDITVLLDGPFNGIDMNTHLNSILPLGQPYNTLPWNYIGTETTALIPNPDIVDWILVELRDAADANNATPGNMIAQQAAFLLNDGSLVDLNGTSILSFDHSIVQSLFVVLWHRSHVGVISANPLVRVDNVYTYDFTTEETQVLGGILGYKELVPGTWGMAGGDGDANGTVESADKTTIWAPDVGTSGYKVSDFNMDTQVDNKDKNDIWHFNSGKESQIPE